MTRYPHFSFPNLFLLNGYREIDSHDGPEFEYDDEDGLEQCIRCLVVRKPERLRGWDLRFLRRGLALSQAEVGAQVDRDSQTIARWEKSNDEIPSAVDLNMRVRFAARFEPQLTTQKILNYIDGKGSKLPASIYLRLTNQGWQFEHEPKVKFARSNVSGSALAQIAASLGPSFRLYENFVHTHSGALVIEPKDVARWYELEAALPECYQAIREGNLLVVKSELPRTVAEGIANEPSLLTIQKLKVDVKGSAHDYANATFH